MSSPLILWCSTLHLLCGVSGQIPPGKYPRTNTAGQIPLDIFPLANNTPSHIVEPPKGRSFIWQIGVNSSIQDRRKSIEVFMESSQLYAATQTHYSTEPLTTGPKYDPLLLLLALAGDVHPNPGPSRYPCPVCFKNGTSQGTSYLCTRCSHWVYSRYSGL